MTEITPPPVKCYKIISKVNTRYYKIILKRTHLGVTLGFNRNMTSSCLRVPKDLCNVYMISFLLIDEVSCNNAKDYTETTFTLHSSSPESTPHNICRFPGPRSILECNAEVRHLLYVRETTV